MNIGIAIGIPFMSKIKKIFAKDSFDRANNATTLGNADTGQAWQVLSATWGITNNKAYVATPTAGHNRVLLDTTKSDGVITLTFAQNVSDTRLIFRCLDANNEFIFYNVDGATYALSVRNAGTVTQLGSFAAAAANGAVLKVVLNGTKIQCYLNGNLIFNVTNSFNSTQTKHGMATYASATSQFDDFKMEEL